jgi:hypothetical protein
MGPGREPRKDDATTVKRDATTELQWGLGVSPGKTWSGCVVRHFSYVASMGPGREPRKDSSYGTPDRPTGCGLLSGSRKMPPCQRFFAPHKYNSLFLKEQFLRDLGGLSGIIAVLVL